MSTAGGPRLEGIGRGGDSDLVFCVDAHDAQSYSGEPTSNIVPNHNFIDGTTINWQQLGTGATLTAVEDSDNPANSPYILKLVRGSANASVYTDLINKTIQGSSYAMSCWAKGDGTMNFGKYDNNSGWSGGPLAVTLTDEWQLITLHSAINGSDTTTSIKFYICSDLTGSHVYLAGPQFERKGYTTPYVWDSYNGRPATTNLMIHGNVGHNYPNILSDALSKFETSVGWTVGQDWSINSGTKVAEITNWTQASFLQRAASPAEVTTGKRYTITADITATAGILYARVGNGSYEAMSAGIGSSVEVTCGSTPTETVLFYSGGWTGTLDNVRVELSEWIDSSPRKHAITAYGTVKPSNTQSKFPGGSIYFDGSGDYLKVAEYLGGDWSFGSDDFTIDAWIYLANVSTYHVIAAQDDNNSNKSWQFRTNTTTGDLLFRYSTNGTNEIDFTATSGISINTWHHVAVCRYGSRGEGNNIGTLELFVDGKSKGTTNITNTAFYSAATALTVGMRGDSTLPFEGYMDEVRITKGTALWRSNDSSNVKLMIHGNVGSGTTFEDSSASEVALTNNNGVSHAGTSEFGGTALKFVRSSSQWIQTASTDAADFGTGDWTVDYWFNMTNGQTDRMHSLDLGIYTGCGGGSNISFNFNDGNGFWLYWNGCGSPNIIFGSDGDYGDGAWHHMAVTRHNGMIRVWVDGVHKGSNNYSSGTSMGDTTNVDIGASGGGVLWDGYLDEIRITKGTALWIDSGNFTPPTRRDTLSVFVPPTKRDLSAPIVDLSGNYNGINLATTNTTDVTNYRVGEVIKPVANTLWDFDGTDEYFDTGLYLSSTCSISLWYKRTEPDITSSADDVMNVNAWNNTGSNNFFYMQIGDPYYNPSPEGSVSCWAYGFTSGVRADWHPTPAGGAYEILSKLNVWRNLCLTFDSSKGYVYMDGVFINSDDLPFTGWKPGDPGYSASGNGLSTLLFGAKRAYGSTAAPDGYFNGQMAQCMVFDTTLTAQQVKQNFNAQRSRFGV